MRLRVLARKGFIRIKKGLVRGLRGLSAIKTVAMLSKYELLNEEVLFLL
jgi:hypothetical protein